MMIRIDLLQCTNNRPGLFPDQGRRQPYVGIQPARGMVIVVMIPCSFRDLCFIFAELVVGCQRHFLDSPVGSNDHQLRIGA